MKQTILIGLLFLLPPFLLLPINLFGQSSANCFLDDFEPKMAVIPAFELVNEMTDDPSVTITIENDTIGKISQYIFGNAIASWMGNTTENVDFLENACNK